MTELKNFKELNINAEILQMVTEKVAWEFNVVPYIHEKNVVSFCVKQGSVLNDIENELEFLLGKKVILNETDEDTVNFLLLKYYRKNDNENQKNTSKLSTFSDDFLTKLIIEAHNHNSSDIHIEIFENKARIRLRVDGKLKEVYVINKAEYPSLLNKIKIKANLDISEKRLPQDGRIIFENNLESTDIRVSILPTLYGEKAVLRLLKKDATDINLKSLGFSKKQLDDYLIGIKKTNGIILISGPTGSGKTTTLYATLKVLNKVGINILTIEDPIEYTLEGVNQVQLKENIGLSFSSALRTFLRQDPDIIMLGEIRDGETAQMAIRAALTGHLVLSTIHTNSAWGTIGRLIDMGVPPFLISATLNLSVAQRLVRLLCNDCKLKLAVQPEELPFYPKEYKLPEYHYLPNGCSKCYYTGFNGRKAIYEVIPVDQEIKSLIKKNDTQDIHFLKDKNITFLIEQAYELFYKGETTYEEIAPILLSNSY
ncbi:MAG: GspE/PulE family protein [Bacteroidetes bacterium]|nr:GspE/PulE family protein [Bacteroidota bacterium]